ncbi:copper chaperone PCu(A)C [Sneathiella glossodoripedis]|uniref:copper chaperone PCu(A)C n=1 Tax=Sneathiella glossodoripedis TaxID=418853 RepID=UPI00131EE848|nr:copper chaperone PCu(A)C [Sneathiella glossodoripedis]
MIKFPRMVAMALVVCASLAAFPVAAVKAAGSHAVISVENAWARASKVKVAGAFMTLNNKSTSDDILLSASSDVAKRVEIHTTKTVDGVMKMIEMEEGVVVPASGSLVLKPGSYHVMLMGLKHPLKEGDTFAIRLKFKHADEVEALVTVMAAGAMEGMKHEHGSHSMQHKKHKHD